jgi:hypothetical protein
MSSESKFLVQRRFRLARSSGEAERDLFTWAELVDPPMVVLLGDPGAGKSTELEREAGRTGGSFLSIREFLLPVGSEAWPGPLFLDGLDEVRASGSDRNSVLLQVVQKLVVLGRPQIRLSCRAPDWFGELDHEDLARAYATEEIRIVELQPLRDQDIEEIVQASGLDDPAAFLERARRQGLANWLGNPQTLELMIEVARKGALPDTKAELFEKACLLMASEENPRRRRARSVPAAPEKILDAAGILCATALIAGLAGFAGDRSDRSDDFPSLDDIKGASEELLRAAVESRLFRWEEGQARPLHRTIAEFLAARTLRDRIVGGLPLERVLRLITGHDGGTVSDLRGLFAWLTSLAPQHAEALARRDPAAAIFYGDPEPLPPGVKRAVLACLERLADRYPWFFYEGQSQSFGALSDADLIPDFRAALADPDRPRYFRLAVLAILAYGRPLPDLKADLRRIVYDRDSLQGIRELALKALLRVTSDKSELLEVLEDVQKGTVLDEQDSMRAHLLESLYSEVVKPGDLAVYLTVPKDPHSYGDYHRFVRKTLTTKTPDQQVPDLLDALADPAIWSDQRKGWPRGAWPELAGTLLQRGLKIHGDSAPAARLWSWLRIGRYRGVLPILENEDQAVIRAWFDERPQCVLELYKWWALEGAVAEGSFWGAFWSALYNPKEPPDLWRWQLSTAAALGPGEQAYALLHSVVLRLHNGAVRPTLDEIFEWADQNPAFQECLESFLSTKLPSIPHDPDREEQDRREAEEEAARRAGDCAYIEERIEAVRRGQEKWILDCLASRFLEPAENPSGELRGLGAIREEFGEEITRAAEEGFLAALGRPDWAKPEEIGEQIDRGEGFLGGYALLAGALLAQEKRALPTLAESSGLQAALAFEFVDGVYEPSLWYRPVIQGEPIHAAEVVESVWRPLLKTQPQKVQHLFHMDREPAVALIAQQIGLRLLEGHAQAQPELLKQLMRAALVGSSRADLSILVERELPQQNPTGDQYTLWLALGLLAIPEKCLLSADSHLKGQGSTERADRLVGALKDLNGIGGHSVFHAPSVALIGMFKLLSAILLPPNLKQSRIDQFDRSQFVARLASELGSRLDDESVAGLGALRDDPELSAWKEKLSEIAEHQIRSVRESRYERPSLEDVLKVLTDSEPTSPGDLHAIVGDHLRTLIDEIEHGSGSGYRTFWNVSGSGDQLQSPVVENDARSRLADLLNERLKPSGITAEIEGHYSGGNRGDLKVIYKLMKIPVEAKRHFHPEVWTAPRTQLKEKYTIDPASEGSGIYLVFWFGEDEGRRLPAVPAGIAHPKTAAEMESALRQIYSGEKWSQIEFFCIDCSP